MAVEGDVADAGVPAFAYAEVGEIAAAELDHTAADRPEPEERLDQFELAVAFDAGDAEDLALMDREGDVVDDDPVGLVVAGREADDLEFDDVGDGRLLGVGGGELTADHQFAEPPLVDVGREHGGDRVTVSDDGDLVGDGQHLVELVADEQDGDALGDEMLEVAEQLVDLLGDEHGSGLVEDQDAGAAVQHLEDLDALAFADAEVLDDGVEIEVDAIGLLELAETPARPGVVDHPTAGRLGTEDDVLECAQVVGEHEMLVDHADAGSDRIGGRSERFDRAVDRDGALVGAVHPVQGLHQGRLARAVLTDDRVDRSGRGTQVDVAVGDDPGEPFPNSHQFHGERCAVDHVPPSSLQGAQDARCEKGPVPPKRHRAPVVDCWWIREPSGR